MIGLNRVILLTNIRLSMAKFSRIFFIACGSLLFASLISVAQVNAVEFGKNRVQYKKFKWQYYQTKNFNTYFNQNGQELAKFVLQVAEEALKPLLNIAYSGGPTLLCTTNLQIYNNQILA
jgi:hypothetical protein